MSHTQAQIAIIGRINRAIDRALISTEVSKKVQKIATRVILSTEDHSDENIGKIVRTSEKIIKREMLRLELQMYSAKKEKKRKTMTMRWPESKNASENFNSIHTLRSIYDTTSDEFVKWKKRKQQNAWEASHQWDLYAASFDTATPGGYQIAVMRHDLRQHMWLNIIRKHLRQLKYFFLPSSTNRILSKRNNLKCYDNKTKWWSTVEEFNNRKPWRKCIKFFSKPINWILSKLNVDCTATFHEKQILNWSVIFDIHIYDLTEKWHNMRYEWLETRNENFTKLN